MCQTNFCLFKKVKDKIELISLLLSGARVSSLTGSPGLFQAPLHTPVKDDLFSIFTEKGRIPIPILPGRLPQFISQSPSSYHLYISCIYHYHNHHHPFHHHHILN